MLFKLDFRLMKWQQGHCFPVARGGTAAENKPNRCRFLHELTFVTFVNSI